MNKMAFLFPGQGSQYPGMGKDFYDNFTIAKSLFEEANDTLNFDIKKLCFEGSVSELTQTANAQPAILAVSIVSYEVYMQELGIMPSYMAGHSLGEYSALVCSRAVKFHDALKIVRQRGKIMQEATSKIPGKMAAISGGNKDYLEGVCNYITTDQEPVVIACYNSLNQNVISGHKNAVEKVVDIVKGNDLKVTYLQVGGAFHSPMMRKAADVLETELNNHTYNDFICPVISNATSLPYIGKNQLVENLKHQMFMPVKWVDTMFYLQSHGIKSVVEIGPRNTLGALAKNAMEGVEAYSVGQITTLQHIKAEFYKKTSLVNSKIKTIESYLAAVIGTKNYNYDLEAYREGVIKPYHKIKNILEESENGGIEPTQDQLYFALELLRSIFNIKKIPYADQNKIIIEIEKEISS